MDEEKRRYFKLAVALCSLLLLVSNAAGSNDSPIEALRTTLDQMIHPLKHPPPGLQAESGGGAGEAFHRLFDFREISRRSAASYWADFSLDQRDELTRIFSQLLTSVTLKRIQQECVDNDIAYLSHEMLSETKAVVKTKILGKNLTDIAISYSMKKRENAWRVYDINIEGISLIHNYRSQFRKILMKEKPAFLITLLQERGRQQEIEEEAGKRLLADLRPTDTRAEWQQFAQTCFLAIWLEAAELKGK